MASTSPILIEVAPGELIDKITILEIKLANIPDPGKLTNVRHELSVLSKALADNVASTPDLRELTRELKSINETLWRIEDEIRDLERAKDFGPRFVELARSVYRTNDARSAVKRRINELLNSALIEEKSYAAY